MTAHIPDTPMDLHHSTDPQNLGVLLSDLPPDSDEDYVNCVVISVETRAAFKRLRARYPVGTEVDGIFIAIDLIGEIKPQPRMSGGN